MDHGKTLRYFTGCTGRARGGWYVAKVILVNGKEVARPVSSGLTTKVEAKRIAKSLNEDLKGE
jgi:hypothetical protein